MTEQAPIVVSAGRDAEEGRGEGEGEGRDAAMDGLEVVFLMICVLRFRRFVLIVRRVAEILAESL